MQSDNSIDIEIQENNGYQVFVNDITWSKDYLGKFRAKTDNYDQLPKQMTLSLPDTIAKKESMANFYDIVETFIYNLLAKRFNRIAYHCQIWLIKPDEENEENEELVSA